MGKPREPTAELTRFGWTLMSSGSEPDLTKMFLTQTSRLDAGNGVANAQGTRRKRVLPSIQSRSAEDRLSRGSSRRSKTSVFASEDQRGRPRRDEVSLVEGPKDHVSGDTQIHTSTIRAVHITIPSRRNYRSAPAKPSAEFPKRSRRS